jgi:hypothetical protein
MVRLTNRLNHRSIASLGDRRHADGNGLYLSVGNGGRSWTFMYRFNGRRVELGFGSARTVSLARARDLARNSRNMLAEGVDPKAARRPTQGRSFAECAARYLRRTSRNGRVKSTPASGAKGFSAWRRSCCRSMLPRSILRRCFGRSGRCGQRSAKQRPAAWQDRACIICGQGGRLHNTDRKSNCAASSTGQTTRLALGTNGGVGQRGASGESLLAGPGLVVRGRSAPAFWGTAMFTPLECRLRAADCQRMSAHAPNPRLQAILTDMGRTWTRLALEAEQR